MFNVTLQWSDGCESGQVSGCVADKESLERIVKEMQVKFAVYSPFSGSDRPVLDRIPKVDSRWKHHNGNEYRVVMLANLDSMRAEYPPTVVYVGANGKVWSRPVARWHSSMTPITE